MKEQLETLDMDFLIAMNEIGMYGRDKYKEQSFDWQAKKGSLSRSDRTQSEEIARHADNHFDEYLAGVKHDHFGTLRHQLAASAFNAMMEYIYAVKADGKKI